LDRGSVPLTRAELDLNRLLAEIKQKTQAIVTARKVELVMPEPPTTPADMEVDMVLFQRALENIVTHAIKSAPSNTNVTVVCTVTSPVSPDDFRLHIEIKNDGSHLDQDDLLRIFDRFAVMMLKERGQSHVGLGLAHCRMVVEAHGGRVAAINRDSKGLTFTIDMP
jgi:K+-sensing histidine kinase KdpD